MNRDKDLLEKMGEKKMNVFDITIGTKWGDIVVTDIKAENEGEAFYNAVYELVNEINCCAKIQEWKLIEEYKR